MFNLFILGIGYLLGSLPSGYLAGKWIAQIDLRQIGSGSTGATNVLRHVGKWPALTVFLVDVAKGLAAVLIAKGFSLSSELQVVTGIATLIGHIWPIWLRWKGGKAVATGLGVFLGLSWPVGMACLGIFLTVLTLSKIVSLSSIFAALSLPFLMFISFQSGNFNLAYFSISLITSAMVLWRHRSNLKRLLKGSEPRITKPSK